MLWLRKILRAVFAPFLTHFSWWYGKKRGQRACIVLVPDFTNILTAFFLACFFILPYTSLRTLAIAAIALLFSPLILTGLLWVSAERILFIRLFCGLPYWFHRIGKDQIFTLYEAWEDPVPTGVAFESASKEGLHIGGVRSALPIYHFVGQTLAQLGWQQDTHGWNAPKNADVTQN